MAKFMFIQVTEIKFQPVQKLDIYAIMYIKNWIFISFEMSLLNCVRLVPRCLTCLCTLRAYVPTCLKLLGAYVPTCPYFLPAYVPSFFTCLYIFLMPPCLHAINYFVSTYAHFSRAYVEISHKIYWGSLLHLLYSCIAVFLWIIWPFIPLKTPKQTPVSKTVYHNPILWVFFISTGVCTERIIWGLIKSLSKTMDSF